MPDEKFKLTKDQKFLRGLIFISAGAFLLLRFAAQNDSIFFRVASWGAAIIALVALGFYLRNIFEGNYKN